MSNWLHLSEQVYRRTRQSRVAIVAAVLLTLLAFISLLIAVGKAQLLGDRSGTKPVAVVGREAG